MQKRTYPIPAALAVVFVVTCLAYSNSFNAAFHFDDIPKIVKNKVVRDVSGIPRFFYGADGGYLLKDFEFRPVKYATLAVNYYISGDRPWSYHLFNLLIHIFNSFLVFIAVRQVLKDPDKDDTAALLASAMFALHPVQSSAVMYMSNGRAVLLACMFYLLAFISFVRYRDSGPESGRARYAWASLTPVFYMLGLLSKEIAGSLPAVLLAYDMLFTVRRRGGPGKSLKAFLCYVPVAAVLGAFLLWKLSVHGYLSVRETPYGALEYLMSEFKAALLYLRQMLIPVNQNADYYLPLTKALDLKAVIGLCAVLASGISLYLVRKKHPAVTLFGLWFLIAIAPESSVVSFEDIAVEYRLYLPSVGLIAAAAYVLSRGRPYLSRQRLWTGLTASILALFALLTFARVSVWATEYTLWSDAAKKSPGSPRAHLNLGEALMADGRYQEAVAEFKRSLSADPGYRQAKDARYQMGLCLIELGRPEDATGEFEAVIKSGPGYMNSYGRLGEIYFGLGRYKDSERVYRAAVEHGENGPVMRYNLAVSNLMNGRYQDAKSEMEPLMAYFPGSYDAHYNLALIYEKLGMKARAAGQAAQAAGLAADEDEKRNASEIIIRNRGR